jgi:hypothetical protein
MLVNKSTSFLASDSPYESDRESTINPISASTSLPSYDIPTSPIKPVLANTKPLLVTPVIEPIEIPPKGSGASVVAEPDLGTPIIKNDTISPVSTGGVIGGLPPNFGSGAGAGSGTGSDTGAMKNGKKKPNYVLYLGILLAVIIVSKLLSSKKEN